jgi:hypothetical protein
MLAVRDERRGSMIVGQSASAAVVEAGRDFQGNGSISPSRKLWITVDGVIDKCQRVARRIPTLADGGMRE